MRFEPSGLSTPGEARHFAAASLEAELSGPAFPSAVDAVTLIVSELVTNAVRAGATAVGVELEVHRSHLRLCVDDDAEGWPHQQQASDDDAHGRGLAIVASLAAGWAAESTRDGKRVWADVRFAENLTQASPCSL